MGHHMVRLSRARFALTCDWDEQERNYMAARKRKKVEPAAAPMAAPAPAKKARKKRAKKAGKKKKARAKKA
jgi:hypothetical protein